ncbi:MAG: DUF4062 domain-containing protein [Cyclobacteriaceae bacterium]
MRAHASYMDVGHHIITMDKRYQVFISSTYADLKDERSKVIQTLMEMDCIPAGMEIFPAIDDEQFNFIKRVIDDCDYYIVIIGGRYGSLSDDGLSYTEKEFDYACQKGIKVVALLHAKPEKIPVEKSDIDPELRAKLETFREKVGKGRLVKFWEKAEDLPGLVALSLSKTIKTYPAQGWVRSTTVGSPELLGEINELRKTNELLKQELDQIKNELEVDEQEEELAGLEDEFTVRGKYSSRGYGGTDQWEVDLTWGEIFFFLSPYLMQHPSESAVRRYLSRQIRLANEFGEGSLDNLIEDDLQTIKIHLETMKLITVKYQGTTEGGMDLFWHLTDLGTKVMRQLRSVKK